MIISYLQQIHQVAINKVAHFTERKNWKIELTLSVPFIILFFSFPSYEWMFDKSMTNWSYIIEQAAHPFVQQNYDSVSHQSKLTFRLFVPFLVRIFHLNIIGITILQFIFGTLMIYFFVKAALKITQNKISTVLLTLAFSSIAICKSPFNDILGYLDGIALFFLILPFAFNNTLLIFIGIFLASWVDERGLIASSLIFVWVLFIKKDNKKIIEILVIFLAWISYFAIRFFLTYNFKLITHTDSTGFSVLINNINNAPIGIWTGLEGFWLLISLSFLVLYKQNKIGLAILFFGGISIIVIVSLSVLDITRSMMYLFPSIFIALSIIKEVESEKNLIYISTVVLLLCALFPMLSAGGYNSVNWQYPLPLQLLRYLTN